MFVCYYRCMETRVIIHDENHCDIEALVAALDDAGNLIEVWTVIECHENKKMVQTQQAKRPASNPCGCIQDLPQTLETAKTEYLEEVMNSMNQYRITYYRPYLPAPERFEAQRTVVTAKDEAEVRKIYSDCDITFIEELHPVEAAYQQEKQFSDAWCDPALDDPRTETEKALDDAWLDEQATRASERPF